MDRFTEFILKVKNSGQAEKARVVKVFQEKEGKLFNIPDFIGEEMKSLLHSKGIDKLYIHQEQGLKKLAEGENIIVTTPTGSGKTLIYNLFMADRIAKNPGIRALYIFPTKALAQDQLKTLREFKNITAEIYDGDTPEHIRRKIRSRPPNIILTNPDMLHMGILPFHHSWRKFLSSMEFVVIDEAHTYKGIFGSHVSHVIKRMSRICNYYGSSPKFALLSATINEPLVFAEKLTGLPFCEISGEDSPAGKKYFVFVSPENVSPYSAAIDIFTESLKCGLSTIIFTKSRRASELLQIWARQKQGVSRESISAYRAGYLAEERREIEQKLFSGAIRGVISTSALEVGMDIGGLDCCILFGYPGSITSSWQRIGRVGRGRTDSAVIFIGLEDALDRYFMRNPEEFFKRKFEDVIINPENPVICESHLRCASAEMPLSADDIAIYGPAMYEIVDKNPSFEKTPDRKSFCYIGRPPHREVNIRTSGDTYSITDSFSGKVIGSIEENRAFSECYPGSVYLHHGRKYETVFIEQEKKKVSVKPVQADFYTQPNWWEKIEIISEKASRFQGVSVKFGNIKVTSQVISYEKRREKDKTLIGLHQLSLPAQELLTESVWVEIPEETVIEFKKRNMDFHGALHAAEHAMIGILPLAVTCDRWDVGGYSFPFHSQTKSAALFIYDGYPGGAGITKTAYQRFGKVVEAAYEIIIKCPCESGCPSCIQSPKCGSGNDPLDKQAALLLLEKISEFDITS